MFDLYQTATEQYINIPILSAKRQVTLPKDLCDKVDFMPGDDLEFFEYQSHIIVIKRKLGASKGALSHLAGRKNMPDDQSLGDAVLSESQSSTL
jgi:bifunctional DNA-binding transcriptional regulator/antitoxin component of YhaV-PrlF toxin-antitoxin module